MLSLFPLSTLRAKAKGCYVKCLKMGHGEETCDQKCKGKMNDVI